MKQLLRKYILKILVEFMYWEAAIKPADARKIAMSFFCESRTKRILRKWFKKDMVM